MRARVLLLLAVLSLPELARAEVPLGLSVDPEVGLGYDTSVYLEASALPDIPQEQAGICLVLVPQVQAAVGARASHHLLLDYGLDFRQVFFPEGGDDSILLHGGGPTYVTAPFGGFRLALAGAAQHLFIRELQDGGWWSALGALQLRRPLGSVARMGLGYQLQYTDYGSTSTLDWELAHQGRAELAWRVARGLVLEPGYAFYYVDANPSNLASMRHQPSLSVQWRLPRVPVTLVVHYALTVLLLDQARTLTGSGGKPGPTVITQRTDLLHQVGEELRYRPLPWLGVFVRHQTLWGTSSSADIPDYSRHQVLAGVALSWEGEREGKSERPSLDPAGRLQVQVRAPQARSVSVVGSFNNWDPERGRLALQGEMWAGSFDLEPGKHTYMLQVDDKMVDPPGCPAWEPDGFGGKSCRILVERSR